MTTWLTDHNGNRCSVEYWGSSEEAQKALDSLKSCRNCTNCSCCSYCSNCSRCSHCSNCLYCFYCEYCSYCSHCSCCLRCRDCVSVQQLESPLVVGPTRSDGYQFCMGASGSVHAGCRVFKSMAEAREHWERTRGGTPLGDETMRILNHLERMFRIRKS